ncbi:hypothetical protein CDAR_485731 [Caerostris darwini]|uniref:Uncharacterized protein n=1 Tax=Caerostris darwini TaxID=1538125 RepID=A0AAV4WIQ2_9ARAC|nr:hypothetical protein CDAR_485731 [Caerostris darwini]
MLSYSIPRCPISGHYVLSPSVVRCQGRPYKPIMRIPRKELFSIDGRIHPRKSRPRIDLFEFLHQGLSSCAGAPPLAPFPPASIFGSREIWGFIIFELRPGNLLFIYFLIPSFAVLVCHNQFGSYQSELALPALLAP